MTKGMLTWRTPADAAAGHGDEDISTTYLTSAPEHAR
jgi:hypothetical protein